MTLPEKFLAASEFKAVCKINYNDLDEIITEFFCGPKPENSWWKSPYEMVAYEEWGNYESHEFAVRKEKMDETDVEEAKRGKWNHYSTSRLLNHLCAEGIIPECELIVKVYW